MRLSRSLASVTMAVALVLALPYEATSHARVQDGKDGRKAPQLFGAACRTKVRGSEVVAYCHNPYVDVDRVSLHIECARWWDIDTDTAPIDTDPAMTVRMAGRCWKEVGSVWISHRKVD